MKSTKELGQIVYNKLYDRYSVIMAVGGFINLSTLVISFFIRIICENDLPSPFYIVIVVIGLSAMFVGLIGTTIFEYKKDQEDIRLGVPYTDLERKKW